MYLSAGDTDWEFHLELDTQVKEGNNAEITYISTNLHFFTVEQLQDKPTPTQLLCNCTVTGHYKGHCKGDIFVDGHPNVLVATQYQGAELLNRTRSTEPRR